ncbi:MAG: hypothetical protein KF782_28630 [Labilithrix sp.]|nr:hypothetical protein [Labilithrix sp.]
MHDSAPRRDHPPLDTANRGLAQLLHGGPGGARRARVDRAEVDVGAIRHEVGVGVIRHRRRTGARRRRPLVEGEVVLAVVLDELERARPVATRAARAAVEAPRAFANAGRRRAGSASADARRAPRWRNERRAPRRAPHNYAKGDASSVGTCLAMGAASFSRSVT